MAFVLLVDPNAMARKALQGILARGEHRLAVVDAAQAALDFVRRNVRVDLVITELTLSGEGGLALVERLKSDCLLKLLPVVVYTGSGDRHAVKRALELRVQNFLLKPYVEEAIYAEIAKVESNPWHARLFEEEKSFCRMMGVTPEELRRALVALRSDGQLARSLLLDALEKQQLPALSAVIEPLREQAEAAGAWGLVDCLGEIVGRAEAEQWNEAGARVASLDFALDLIAHWVDRSRIGPDFEIQLPPDSDLRAAARAHWRAAPHEGRCPMVTSDGLMSRVEALACCPVIDSAAAEFQMLANGHPSSINPLMDVVARDPGLTVQVLLATQKLRSAEDEFAQIEDARLAVSQLGEVRLQQLARNLVLADEAALRLPPIFDWTRYWLFQRAVARIAQLICRDLEFDSLETAARTAGQLHDFGLLLVCHLEPAGLQAIIEHAHAHGLTRCDAERLFLGCTSRELAVHFASRFNLSRRYVNVLRWLDQPEAATEDRQLVAIISLARDLCRHNRIGTCGEPVLDDAAALERTAEWQILREGLYPSFNLRKFEQQVHTYCIRLRTELSGHQTGTVADLLQPTAAPRQA